MPQTQAAEKALRISERRRVVNDRWRRKMRESVKQVRDAITKKEKDVATAALLTAQKTLDRAARHNVIHHRTAARKKSQLQRAISAL